MDEAGDNWSEDGSWMASSNFFTEFPEYQQNYQNDQQNQNVQLSAGGGMFQRRMESLNDTSNDAAAHFVPYTEDYSNSAQGHQPAPNRIKKENSASNIPQPINTNSNPSNNNNPYLYNEQRSYTLNNNNNNHNYYSGIQQNAQMNKHVNNQFNSMNNNNNNTQQHNNHYVHPQQTQPVNQNRPSHPPPQLPKMEVVSPPQPTMTFAPQPTTFAPQPIHPGLLTLDLLQRSRQKGPGWHSVESDEPVRITAGKGKLFKVRVTSPLPFTKESICLHLVQGKSELRIQRIGEVKKLKNMEDTASNTIYCSDIDIKIFKGSKNIQLCIETNDPRSPNLKLTATSVPFMAHDDGKASAPHAADNLSTVLAPPPTKKRRHGAAFKGKEHVDDSDEQPNQTFHNPQVQSQQQQQQQQYQQQQTVNLTLNIPPDHASTSPTRPTMNPLPGQNMLNVNNNNNNNNSSGDGNHDYYHVDEYHSSSSNPNSSPLHSTSSPASGLSPPQQNSFAQNEQIAIHDGDLYVNGMLRAHGFIQYSDILLKTDIEQIVDALSIIRQFGGKKYRWKEDNALGIPNPPGGRKVIGLIAQEVQKVLPEAVELDKATGYLSVSYSMIVPVLLEALKQHLEEYEQQQAKVNKSVEGLRDNIATIKEKLEEPSDYVEEGKIKELEKITAQMEIVAERISNRKAKRLRKEEEKERKRLEKLRRRQAQTGIGASDWREKFGVVFAVICFTCAMLVACIGLALAIVVATQLKDWSKATDGTLDLGGSVEVDTSPSATSAPDITNGLSLGIHMARVNGSMSSNSFDPGQASQSESSVPSLRPTSSPSNRPNPSGGTGQGQGQGPPNKRVNVARRRI
eukprot:TRINITY_DN108_c0_g2_i1.p1 TRINITY_DN108_c0_g2~~TRINITY_DN108_c0_g2_i1.p1  ORF type:complete len:849 (+),score=223.73 TRINITY_DN108_c0_g2_i1:83-2629(+)